MAKNYHATTEQWMAQNGLVRHYSNDAATGEKRLRYVTAEELKKIKKGRLR